MATTFEVIFLGLPGVDIDPTEGDTNSDNVSALLGRTFGTSGAPLYDQVGMLSPVGTPGNYDTNNAAVTDQFSVDGTTYTMDGWGVYNATVTYADGSTATVEVKLAQATSGHLFLAPHLGGDAAKTAILKAAPLQSIRLDSLGPQGTNMQADREGASFIEAVDGTAGNDTLTVGSTDAQGDPVTSGGDVIRAGDGADSVDAGAGNDTVDGGAGNDTLNGGAGADTVSGGDGDDLLISDGSDANVANTFFGGAGNDTIRVTGAFDRADTIFGGDGRDTLELLPDNNRSMTVDMGAGQVVDGSTGAQVFSGVENITTAGGNDQIIGDGADNILISAAGNDTLSGGIGADSLFAGTGNDTLFGGTGNDRLTGGAGNDTITTGDGNDQIVLADGSGSDVVTDFNMTRVGNRTTDQLDVSDLRNLLGDPVTWADVVVTDTVGDGSGDAILTFPGGERIVLQGVRPSQVDSMGEMAAIGIPCFAPGSLIATPGGPRKVEGLRPGDLVETQAGLCPVIWTGARAVGAAELKAAPALRPIHFAPGAIGNARALRLSGQHGVLMGGVLVRARHLAEAGLPGVRVARGVRAVTWHHILLDRHAILNANGAAVESLYPGPRMLSLLAPPDRLRLALAVARLGRSGAVIDLTDLSAAYGPRVCPLIGRRALRRMLQARACAMADKAPRAVEATASEPKPEFWSMSRKKGSSSFRR